MSRWRVAVLVALAALPVATLLAVGGYALWASGWGFYLWWPMAGCLALAYVLGWYWQRKRQLVAAPDFTPPRHFTGRDAQAWQLVQARAHAVAAVDPARLSDLHYYLEIAREMAFELAQFYHPGSKDPIGPLTLPEILAVIELAAHDLAELVDRTLPGGHLLTINDWRRAQQLSDWYRQASNVYWLVAALFSPVQTALRYAASQVGLSRPLQLLQQNLVLWFVTHYIHRLGTYLIELNSGRLRVGSTRYRELMRQAQDNPPPDAPPAAAVPVTVTLLGQVKVGKSSCVNALLGEQRARTDVLPATSGVTRYELTAPGVAAPLVLLDTAGYGHAGPRPDDLPATMHAAEQADLLLLVLHARNPARQADRQLLEALAAWFADRPHLKRPPILAVLTHIDLLSPAMEWSPPYDWQKPRRPKEEQIAQAVAAVHDQLGTHLVGAVPLCTQPGKVYGVAEGLLPALARLLPEAQAVNLLRCLRQEADTGKVRKVLSQLLNAGTQLAKALWETQAR